MSYANDNGKNPFRWAFPAPHPKELEEKGLPSRRTKTENILVDSGTKIENLDRGAGG